MRCGERIVEVEAAFAARTSRTSLRKVSVFSNRLVLWGILFELAFAAAAIYLPPLQAIFGMNALGLRELAILAVLPFLVWDLDELQRWALRRRERAERVARGDGSRIPKRGER